MPFDPPLLDALDASTIESIEGIVWRQVLSPTSVSRANQRGGRWNELGLETLYTSLDPDTAAAEIGALLAAQPVPITRQRLTYPIRVGLSKVADLRPTPWVAPFAYEFDLEDPTACQLIGAAAAWLGLSGLVVPSVRTRGSNLIVFVSNQGPDDEFESGDPFPFPPGPPDDHHWLPLKPKSD
jgi:RES domain-containing protein